MELVPVLDLSQPPGSQLPPEMVAEIEEVAPSAVNDGDITEAKLADLSVSSRTIEPGAVESTHIATGGVEEINLATDAVTEDKIEDGAVTPAKAGTGIVTAKNPAGAYVTRTEVVLSAAQYAAIVSPDPNTKYYITA